MRPLESSYFMDMVIFTGIPGSGKSTWYKENFFHTHIRVNLDMLKTRKREQKLIDFCLQYKMPLVIDNTNVTPEERAVYISLGKKYRFKVRSIFFNVPVNSCLYANEQRYGRQKVPEVAIFSKAKELKQPTLDEGFDEIIIVKR